MDLFENLNEIDIISDYDLYNEINDLKNEIKQEGGNILDIINVKKEKQLKLKDFLKNGIIKFSNSDYDEIDEKFIKLKKINEDANIENFILKLSGIWENKDYIGITFKIINIKNTIEID